jgi:transcriptional regulator with XRE-family HTH domain
MDARRKPLADYIEGRTTQAKFAKDVRCSESHLSLILQGKRNASLRMARRIIENAKGVIPLEVLIERADDRPTGRAAA